MRSLGKGRMTHDNAHLRSWRAAIGWAARAGCPGGEPTAVDVRVTLHFAVRPRRQGDAPDLDKLARAVLDALSAIAYRDDKQVAVLHAQRALLPPDAAEDAEGVRIVVEVV
jgi:crossover junction endodeoxyribonuclease RusA